jgi:hypothetical protein
MKYFENPSSNPLQRPYSGDFDTENAACDSVKSYRKPPMTSKFLLNFPAANERSALENIDQSQKREFCGGFSKHFQNQQVL